MTAMNLPCRPAWLDRLMSIADGSRPRSPSGARLRHESGAPRGCCCAAPLAQANLWAIDPGSSVAWFKVINAVVLDIDTDASGNVYVLSYTQGFTDANITKFDSSGTFLAGSTIFVGFSTLPYVGFISVNGGYVAAAMANRVRPLDASMTPIGPQRTMFSGDATSLVVDADGFAWIGTASGAVDGFSIPGFGGLAPAFSGNSTGNTGIALDSMSATPGYVYQVNADATNRLSVKQIGGSQSSQSTNAHYGLARRADGSLVTGRANGSVERYSVGGLSSWSLTDTWPTGATAITTVRAGGDITGAVGAADVDGKTAFLLDASGAVAFRWAIDASPAVLPSVAKPHGARLYVGGPISTTWQAEV